jgi:GT2 family glycosyltransferase
VIVVSDGGNESLFSLVAPFTQSLRLRLVEGAFGGPAAARNRGLAVARGEIAVFTDDDCRPNAGWVSSLAAGASLQPPLAVGGSTHNGLPANPYADTAHLVLFLLSRHDRAAVGRERLLPSNNIAFPLAELRHIGGFDERYRTAEDRELCRRWERAGFALGRVPEAIVNHDEDLTLVSFVRKFAAYGRGAARFHGSAPAPGRSYRQSMAFHFHLPALLLPELRRRHLARRAGILGLLLLWELANFVGYLAERFRPSAVSERTLAGESLPSEVR